MKKRHALFLPTSLRVGVYAFAAVAFMTVFNSVCAVDGKDAAKPAPQKVTESQPAKQSSVSTPKKDVKPSPKVVVKADVKKDAVKPAASAPKKDAKKPVAKQKTAAELERERVAALDAQLKPVAEKLAEVKRRAHTEKNHTVLVEFMDKNKKDLDAIKSKDPKAVALKTQWDCQYRQLKELAALDVAKDKALKELAKIEKMASADDKDYAKVFADLQALREHLGEGVIGSDEYANQIRARWAEDVKGIQEAYGEALYQEAKTLYSKALKLSGTEKGAELAKEAKQRASDAKGMYYTGNKVATDVALNESINKLNDRLSRLVADLSADCDRIVKYTDFREKTQTDELADGGVVYKSRIDDIEQKLKIAEKLYREKRYIEAQRKCEEVFIRDPYNPDAVRLLDKVYRKLYFYAELRAYNELLRNDAETVWAWSASIPEVSDRKVAPKSRPMSDPLLEKISGWFIDIDITGYKVKDAVREIQDACKKVDPKKVGLNIQFTGSMQKATYADREVTLNLKKTPVNVVLDYVTKMCGVSWNTDREGKFVRIGPDLIEHETRTIPMRVTVYRSITNKEDGDDNGAEEKKDDSIWGKGGIEAGVEASTSKRAKPTDAELKRFFEDRGILFDDESSISYNDKTHLLTATNKREQLIKLENLVREIDVEAPLVMVEAKILEMQLSDQEELGFDWIITHDAKTDGWDYGMASPLRDFGLGADKIVNNLNVVPNVSLGGQTKININLTITAVDRTNRIELLSTPKVVAKTGEEAEIKMVRQMYFPESWSEPDTSNINGDSLEFEPSYPEFGEPRDVGLVFTVTPTVGSNNRTIELDMYPRLTDLTGWTDYSYDVTIGAASAEAEDEEEGKTTAKKAATTSHITMKMPEISNREVRTKVKVEDGSTLFIGGMITDKQCNYEDQFPILGDIPVLGRLFRKVAKTTARVNLIISVSPRLISGDGLPLHERSSVGVPEFYR